jgi:hypothetical protein
VAKCLNQPETPLKVDVRFESDIFSSPKAAYKRSLSRYFPLSPGAIRLQISEPFPRFVVIADSKIARVDKSIHLTPVTSKNAPCTGCYAPVDVKPPDNSSTNLLLVIYYHPFLRSRPSPFL